jgi:hypothetical protein
MEIKVETDPSLVSSPILRIRTTRWDAYVWWQRRIRVARYERIKDERWEDR